MTQPKSPNRFRKSVAALMAAAVLVVGVATVASAASPTINACVNKSSKAVRISQNFHSQADCKSSESFKQWNVTGPTGARPAPPVPGVRPGPTGATGATGATGSQVAADRRDRRDGRRPVRRTGSDRSDGCHRRNG